jgi:chloramphenicol 3-O-phosphotransferase
MFGLSRGCKPLYINVLRKRLRLALRMLDNGGILAENTNETNMISAACHQRFSGTTWLVQGVSFALEAQAFRSFTTNNRRRS